MSGDPQPIKDLDDEPTSNFMIVKGGDSIDLNNLPGKKKVQLIREGQVDIDQFISPANMPGAKLKELRERHRSTMEQMLKAVAEAQEEDSDILNRDRSELILPPKPVSWGVGDLIRLKGSKGSEKVCEVKAIDPKKGLFITINTNKGLKDVWVQPDRGEKVTDDGTGDDQ